MIKSLKKLLLLVLCVCILMQGASAANDSAATTAEKSLCRIVGCKAGEILAHSDRMRVGNSGSDWLAFTFALNGVTEDYEEYLRRLEEYVTEQYAQKGCLDTVLATEYHRIALTVLALGADPRAFGTDNEGNPVDLIADGTWCFGTAVSRQGLNGLIYALIALDSEAYTVPEGAEIDRSWLLDQILSMQNKDGGFGFVSSASDVDLSAMTLTALAPYKEEYLAEIENTLAFLSKRQDVNGEFSSFGAANAESASQVIIALCSLGIDPETDARFVKNGKTLLNTLEQYRLEDGTYCHLIGEDWDLIATEQALLALTAVDRLREGKTRIYDFTAGRPVIMNNGSTAIPLIVAAAVVLIGASAVLIIKKERKRGKDDAIDHE